MALFMVFNLWIRPGFIFESWGLIFNFSRAIFLMLPLDSMWSQVHTLTRYCFCGAQWLRITQSEGSTRLGASLPENGNTVGFWNAVHLWEIRWRLSPQKRGVCQLTSLVLCSPFWKSWPLLLGLTGCPKPSVQNYHFTLRNISEKHTPHMIWQCRLWLDTARSGSVQSSLVQSGRALHMQI
jgi:hypothetical protein